MKTDNKKPKRILHLSPFFDNTSGVGTVANSLTKNLEKKGNIVDRLEYRPWKDRMPYTFTTSRIIDKEGKATDDNKTEYKFNTSEELLGFLKRYKFDYDLMHFHNQVFANGLNENLFRHFRNVPKLTQVHCVVPYDNAVLKEKSHHGYEELQRQVRMLNKSDRVVHLTPEVGNIARSSYGAEHPENHEVVYNSAEKPEIDPQKVEQLRKQLSPNNEKLFLYAGRLSEEKGVLELAIAFGKAKKMNPQKKMKLIICGENTSNPEIKKEMIYELNRNKLQEGEDFVFVGKVPQAELANFYAASDFFIQPSRYEHFSVSAAEAFSHRIPVIMTRMDSIKDTFKLDDPRERYAIPIDRIASPNSIADAINYAINADPRTLENLVSRAYQFYSSELTPDKVAGKYDRIYKEMISNANKQEEKSHIYVIPVSRGENIEGTLESILTNIDDNGQIIVSGFGDYSPNEKTLSKFEEHIKSGKLKILKSKGDITKTKSSAINKALSDSSKSNAKYVSLVLPGSRVSTQHKIQENYLANGVYMVHGNDNGDYKNLETALSEGNNPIHQSTTTLRPEILNSTGFFYDTMPYAEDMDFYQKVLNRLGPKAILNTGRKVLE